MRVLLTALIISFLLFATTVWANDAYAQSFKFELANPSQSISVGNNFDVKILINTTGVKAINGDALFNFDNAKLSVSSAKTGNFFTYFSANPLGGSSTKYLVSSWEESVAHAKSSSTDTLFSTVTFNAKGGGSTSLSFDCTDGTEADSNINRDSDSKDIIKCPLPTLSINIGGSGPTATPTATLTPGPTSTPSATPTRTPTSTPRPTAVELPRAGSAEVTIVAIGIGALLTVVGVLLIL